MAKRPKYPPVWHEHQWPTSVVLGIDQSLANTGWALMWFADGVRPHVERFGTIVTSPIDGLTSFEDSLTRGERLYLALKDVIGDALTFSSIGITVVHETPAMASKTDRPTNKAEGAPIAALAVRIAAWECCVDYLVMEHAVHAKKVVTGNGRAEKPDMKVAVFDAVTGLPGRHKVNEHVVDAIALALTAAVDGKIPNRERGFL